MDESVPFIVAFCFLFVLALWTIFSSIVTVAVLRLAKRHHRERKIRREAARRFSD